MPIDEIRTAEQVAAWFRRNGITVVAWAEEHGFEPEIVYALISGRTRGLRGRSHEAAVALGMKFTGDADVAVKKS
ncbi:DNA-binding protein [Variovorax paradoxus]|uniref:DNA-binding protein n=1 Tax=Variovorax paradoxus TaxID=34073 RepID=UPI0021ABC38B|nr:DNA-binding protein [Variovorax paradoxus]UVH60680.1 DNA-binding protein [Variovorax paradoxus]